MNKTREFALMVLDDENGIREDAYKLLAEILSQSEAEVEDRSNKDILEAVEIKNGRAFISEDFAEEELHRLKK